MRGTTLLVVMLMLAGCSRAPETAAPAPPATQAAAAVHWVKVAEMSDVERAFAQARDTNQPVFLYWGAVWCPPCNQVKSTIFSRGDFVEQSRRFVPVYLDGDTPSAQRLGKRFRVSGYPTMILLRPDGTEVTRLAGAVEPAKYLQLLEHGLAGGRSASQALAAALRGDSLPAEDWRLLAFYAWETDEQQLVPKREVAATLKRLAQRCPAGNREASARLALQAIAAAAAGNASKPPVKDGLPRAEALEHARALIAMPEVVRAQFDVVTELADTIVGYATAPKSAARAQLVAAWVEALDRLAADATLPRAGPLWALTAKIALLRLDARDAPLSDALLTQVREQVARVDRETTDLNERQSVISSASHALSQAGLLDESDALLKAELKRSHSPYYFMLGLASNARKRGDGAGAIEWARQAFEASRGRATRAQWGGSYVAYLIEFAPADKGRIESAAEQVIAELAGGADAFSARNRSVLERMDGRLAKWSASRRADDVIERLRGRMGEACARLPQDDPDRAACSGLFSRSRA